MASREGDESKKNKNASLLSSNTELNVRISYTKHKNHNKGQNVPDAKDAKC